MADSSSQREYSKSSSDETDRSDQNYDYSGGSGRSYECVYCKRGFTSAQALGGHMNIHRKHRAPKTNPSNNFSPDHHHQDTVISQDPMISSNLDHNRHEGYSSLRPLLAIQSYTPLQFGHDHQVHVNYPISNSSATWGSSTRPSQDCNFSRFDHPSDVSRDDWRDITALNLGIGAQRREEDDDNNEDDHNKRKLISADHGKDRVEVDLELRLGYDP